MSITTRSDKQPKHQLITAKLRREIAVTHRPGDFLSTELELAERFQVNRHTVRRALDALVDEGILLRQQGRGTVVLHPPIDYTIGQRTRFTENIQQLGRHPTTRVLGRRRIQAEGGVASRLEVEPGTPVVHLETLREVDGVPVCLAGHFLPVDPYEPLLREYRGGSLHELIKHLFKVEIVRDDSVISAALPIGDDALHLKMSPRHPLLRIKSVNRNKRTQVVAEYTLTRCRSDSMQIKVMP